MRRRHSLWLIAITAVAAGGLLFAGGAVGEGEKAEGEILFTTTHKCSMCHGVPAAGIEAKTKSAAMKGSDLGGPMELEFAEIAAFLRKEADLEDVEHKKKFTGTDEELQTILDWLGTLEASE